MLPLVFGLGLFLLLNGSPMAAEIRLLSAGAVEPGLQRAAGQFSKATGHEIWIEFNIAPQIARRMHDGHVADVLIAPMSGLKQQLDAGRVIADGHLGRAGVGVAVRRDAPIPDVSTTEGLKAAVLAAESLVYNTASTGL